MNEMNDAHAYEMQMQIWEPNTWDVTLVTHLSKGCVVYRQHVALED
jgi:hypothetical protein